MKIFGRQPALAMAVINAIVLYLGTLQFGWISGEQANLIVGAISAASAAAIALFVRPIVPAVFAAAITALAAVAASYGLEVTEEQLAGLQMVVVAIVSFWAYGQVSPEETVLTNGSTATGAG